MLYTVHESGRKPLPHERPSWLSDGQIYFVTICVLPRKENILAKSEVAGPLIESFVWRHEQQRWFGHVFLVMPDHVHFLISEWPDHPIGKEIRDWKKFTGRTLNIPWQRDFFEHRLRKDESWTEKYGYILQNPVRAGLAESAEDGPHVWQSHNSDGRLGQPSLPGV